MRFLLVAVLLASTVLTGCASTYKTISEISVDSYTFTKDRVDQGTEGNRGYIMGTPPPASIQREARKRTLIGMDIEIPVLPGEKAKASIAESVMYEEEVLVAEPEGGKPVVVEEETITEEEWIK